MVGLWDGVPASPCSGASDEAHLTLRPTRPKRSRFSNRDTTSPESSVAEFVDASRGKNDRDSELVTKLNISAADERRKMLLAKLRIIDERKAELRIIANSGGGLMSAASSRDITSAVIEAATPEPFEGGFVNPPSTTASKKKNRSKPNLAIDVAAVNSFGSSPVDFERFCSSPTPTATTVYGSPIPSPVPRSKATTPSITHADLPVRRGPRRATRPRTPSVLLNGMPGETVLRKLPVGVLKCKRYSFSKKVISILFKNPSASPFSAPVKELWKPEAIPRYFDVITRPMDLGTIKKNMEGVTYLNMEETNPLFMFKPESFATDVRQVFRNAMIYNKNGDVLYNCASDLLHEFEQMWKELPELPARSDNRRKRHAIATRSNVASKRGRFGDSPSLPTRSPSSSAGGKRPAKKSPKEQTQSTTPRVVPVTKLDENMTPRQMRRRLDYLQKCRIALRARTPLPKGATFYDRAALLHDVELTDAEKNEVAKGIKRLPAAKLSIFLGIVGDVANSNGNEDEEVELDILSFDTKTLRNVEAFLESTLTNFKTIRNSSVGEEFSRPQEFEVEMKLLEKRLASNPKQPQVFRKPSQSAESTTRFVSMQKESEELYASSDESDSGESDSDSDSDGSDSE